MMAPTDVRPRTAQGGGVPWPAALLAAAALAAACQGRTRESFARGPRGGDPDRGERVILSYGCGACHVIPGVRGARGQVAAPLTSFASRTFIDGRLPNAPETLVDWLLNPRGADPATAMPALGLSEQDARDAAAYLYTLD
jgi:cytochrome c2